MSTAPATGVRACPRCRGYVYEQDRCVACAQCGWTVDLPSPAPRPPPTPGFRADQHLIKYRGDDEKLAELEVAYRTTFTHGGGRDYVITCPYCDAEMEGAATPKPSTRRWICGERHIVYLTRGAGGWYSWA